MYQKPVYRQSDHQEICPLSGGHHWGQQSPGLSERTEVVAGARLEQQGAPDGLLWSGLQPQHLAGTTQEEVKIQDRGFQPLFLAPLPDCPLQPR